MNRSLDRDGGKSREGCARLSPVPEDPGGNAWVSVEEYARAFEPGNGSWKENARFPETGRQNNPTVPAGKAQDAGRRATRRPA